MKKMLLALLFPFLFSSAFSQVLINQDFTGTFPPTGWTIDAHNTNWSAVNSAKAGGTAPEVRFNYSPTWTGQSRLISPEVNTTGATKLSLQFKHFLDHYAAPYTIGVATRSGSSGSWNIVWSKVNPSGNITGTEYVTIANSDVGSANFQICWFFDGYSYNLDYWFIDDVKLNIPKAHDVMVKQILVNNQYIPGTQISPKAIVRNVGLNPETFNVSAGILVNGQAVYNSIKSSGIVEPDAEATITFDNYTASASNELFDVKVHTSLTGDMDLTNDTMKSWFNTYTTPRDNVLLEIGTGTWCQYCPGASMGAHDLLTNGKAVAVVKNHNGDSFTNDASNARNSYYGITGYPTAVFDGTTQYVGGSNTVSNYAQYLPIYEEKKPINSAYKIRLFGTASGSNYSLSVYLNKEARTPVFPNLVLHLALTESEIPFAWQGQSMVNNAMRLMAPSQVGTPINWGNNSQVIVPLTFATQSTWVTANLELVAWIQNVDTREVFQAVKIRLSQLQPTPVELTSFTASSNEKGIMLNWITATELNNRGFEIQKSLDGKNFTTIAFVKGAGTTSEVRNYTYTDVLDKNKKLNLSYRLKQFDFNNNISYSNVINVEFNHPVVFAMQQNYPNPFNPSTVITFSIPENEFVTLKVYDVLGKEVATLVNEMKEQGSYDVHFSASNLPSGTYIYKVQAGKFTAVKKMLILK